MSVDDNRKKQKSKRKMTITRNTMKRSFMRSVNYLFDKKYLLDNFNDSLKCAPSLRLSSKYEDHFFNSSLSHISVPHHSSHGNT